MSNKLKFKLIEISTGEFITADNTDYEIEIYLDGSFSVKKKKIIEDGRCVMAVEKSHNYILLKDE